VPGLGLSSCAVRLMTAAGATLAPGVTGSSPGSQLAAYKVATAGTVYAEVKAGYANYAGPYTYTLEDLGPDDHGDTLATADAITFGTTSQGNLETTSDLDVFTFTATANHIYRFSVTPQATSA